MIVSVVGCGESAKEWFKTPYDKSVGVNDCMKFGMDTDYLLCVNEPAKFAPNKKNSYRDRLDTIKGSNAQFVTSLCPEWKKLKPNLQCIRIQRFRDKYAKGLFYFTRSSTFIAIQYAHSLGATEIILWGVDFTSHPDFQPGRATDFELEQYAALIKLIQADGTKVTINSEIRL
jgi:hypothetical protein